MLGKSGVYIQSPKNIYIYIHIHINVATCHHLYSTKDMMLTAAVDEFDTLDADEDRGPGVGHLPPSPFMDSEFLRSPWLGGKGKQISTPPKFNSSPLKNDGWKMKRSFGIPNFQGLC